MEDTIAAISTPIGEGGIAIIRVSGPRAFELADLIFHSLRGKPSEFPSHTIHFGTVGTNGDVIDQVMLSVMRAPRTYTKEDTIEINCHGGLLTARKLLSLCLQNGLRLAEPGEFTKRAFLNGRLDLAQAEAVMDLIQARTERAHAVAVHELRGHFSKKVEDARQLLLTIIAHIEAHIDFPEEDISPDTRESLLRDTRSVLNFLESLLATAREGKILRDGIIVTIVGRPNVGKSSLLNALLGEDRSIVTPIPGTTRDTIEALANIKGIPFLFTDTAGMRRARGRVEAAGIQRTEDAIQRSEIILHVVDASRPFNAADREVGERCRKKQLLLVMNKMDLPSVFRVPKELSKLQPVSLSAKTGRGIPDLCDRLCEIAQAGKAGNTDVAIAINERHRDALSRATTSLTRALHSLETSEPLEIISQELRQALDAIGEITGKTATDDILERVFSTFCIGK